MMRKMIAVMVVVMCCLNSTHANDKKTRFILDFRPGSTLLSPDIEGFTVRNAESTSRESISGSVSWAPSINAGIGFNFDRFDLNLTAGPGYLWNDGFHGSFWQAEAGLLFKLAEGRLRVGPHIGILGLGDATWDPEHDGVGKDNVDLSGNTGFKAGLSLLAGSERFAFLANIDFVDNNYDVTTNGGWVAQDKKGTPVTELDMSGVMIDLGLMIRF